MWNNRSNYLLLIKIRHQSINLTLPIPLFILNGILVILNDMASVWSKYSPHQKLPSLITSLCLELFQELRRFGSWTLMELSDGESQISIKLY